MALTNSNKPNFKEDLTPSLFAPKRVVDIILDINHEKAAEYGGYDAIGTIFYTDPREFEGEEKPYHKPHARPLFDFLKKYPLKNEIIMVLTSVGRNFYSIDNASLDYYLPNINIWNHPHHNALPDFPYLGGNNNGEVEDYKIVEGGIIRVPEEGDHKIKLGEYFNEKLDIQPLLPFEGDTIIEGRFGNSIRFGATALEAKEKTAYSTKGTTGDPITIIRNGQYIEEDRDRGWEHTIENINTDDSSIVLTSNQVFPNFKVVSEHYQSWQTKTDYLAVGEAEDDWDNITLGAKPKEIEMEKDPDVEPATEEEVLEDDENNEPTPEFVKIYDPWSFEFVEVTASAVVESDDGTVKANETYTYASFKPEYELKQVTSSAIKDLEGREDEILEEEGSIYDLLVEQDNFSESGFDWTVEDEFIGGKTRVEKEAEEEIIKKDPNKDANEADNNDDETAEPNTTDPPVDPPPTGSTDDQTDPDPVKTEVSRETQNDGSIIITYSDGSTETIPAPLDPPKMKDESPTISSYVGDGESLYITTEIATKTSDFKHEGKTIISGYRKHIYYKEVDGKQVYDRKALQYNKKDIKENSKEPHYGTGKTYQDYGSAGIDKFWRYYPNRNGFKYLIPPMTSLSTAINKWRYCAYTNEAAHWTDKRTLCTPENGGRQGQDKSLPSTGIEGVCIHTTAGAPKNDGAGSVAGHVFSNVWPAFGYHWMVNWKGEVVQTLPDHWEACNCGISGKNLKKGYKYVQKQNGVNLVNSNTVGINWIGGGWSGTSYCYGLAQGTKIAAYSRHPMYKIGLENKNGAWHSLGSGRFGRVPGYGTMTDAQIKVLTELVYIYIQRYPEVVFFGHNQQGIKDCPWFWVPEIMAGILDLPDSPLKKDPAGYKEASYY